MAEVDGIWRMIKGRRVFIKNGQSLTEAMRESGKFENKEISNKTVKIIDKNTEEFSKKIMNQNKESAIVFDDDGKEIMFKNGEQFKVEFRGQELQHLKEMNFTHNHPTTSDYDSTFSKQDLIFAYDNDLKSISSINQKGDIITLQRDKNIKYDDEHKPGFLAGDYQRYKEKVTTGVSKDNLSDSANDIDKWLSENAEKYGYRYERKVANNNLKKGTTLKEHEISKNKKYSEEELHKMTSKELATLLVEDQVNRGVVKLENKELQIKMRLTGSTKMSKSSLIEYVKKNL